MPLVFLVGGYLSACQPDEELVSDSLTPTLYVATGVCNSGNGVTTYTSVTATKTIERFNSLTGASLGTLFDYNSVQSGLPAQTYPVGIHNLGSSLYVLNEGGTTGRSVITVPKSSAYSYSTYIAANATTFATVLNGFYFDDEGSVLISETTGVEKFNSTPTRLLANGGAWATVLGGSCTGGALGTSAVLTMSASGSAKGHLIISNQGATAASKRLSIVDGNTGYIGASSCLSGVQIDSVTHTKAANLTSGTIAFVATGTSPTSMVFVPHTSGTVVGKLLVSYSNNQTSNPVAGSVITLNHGIVSWDVSQPTADTAALSNPVVLFADHTVVFAVSAMAYDSTTRSLYVAVGGVLASANQASTGLGYNIEKFSLDMTNADTTGPELTRENSTFILGGSNTRCINSMDIGD